MLLARMVRCAKCGAGYRLELSGKRLDEGVYKYRYYNCARSCRIGAEACVGGRVRAEILDRAVADHVVDAVCTLSRSDWLRRELIRSLPEADSTEARVPLPARIRAEWRALLLGDGARMRNYLLRLIERIEVRDDEVTVVAKAAFR